MLLYKNYKIQNQLGQNVKNKVTDKKIWYFYITNSNKFSVLFQHLFYFLHLKQQSNEL